MKLLSARGPEGQAGVPGQVVDCRNARPVLRNRKILETVLLYDFKSAREPSSFGEGTIYNAADGMTWRANLRLQADGTLLLRACVATPLFGRSHIWTRVQ